jgi:hypothetical protein
MERRRWVQSLSLTREKHGEPILKAPCNYMGTTRYFFALCAFRSDAIVRAAGSPVTSGSWSAFCAPGADVLLNNAKIQEPGAPVLISSKPKALRRRAASFITCGGSGRRALGPRGLEARKGVRKSAWGRRGDGRPARREPPNNWPRRAGADGAFLASFLTKLSGGFPVRFRTPPLGLRGKAPMSM